jgi:hypothetical protein
MKVIIFVVISALFMTFSYAVVGNASLITNGSFETGVITPATSGYTHVTGVGSSALYPEGTYAVGINPQAYHNLFASFTAQDGAMMMIVNGNPSSNAVVWSQTVNVAQNTTYVFSAYAASVYPASPANLDFEIGINGILLGTLNLTSTVGQWDLFSKTWNSGDSTTATLSIFDRNTILSGNDFALDNIQLNPVPIPGTILLLASGLVGLVGIGRKFTK